MEHVFAVHGKLPGERGLFVSNSDTNKFTLTSERFQFHWDAEIKDIKIFVQFLKVLLITIGSDAFDANYAFEAGENEPNIGILLGDDFPKDLKV